jgi:hypothetical protein
MNERIAIAGSDQGRGSSPIELVLGHWRRSRDGMDEARRAVLRQQVAGLLIRAEVLRLTLQRANARATAGVPVSHASVTRAPTRSTVTGSSALHREPARRRGRRAVLIRRVGALTTPIGVDQHSECAEWFKR